MKLLIYPCIFIAIQGLWLLLFVPVFGLAQASSFAKASDHSIHYITYGEGEPILIINGGPGMNCEGFRSLAADLGSDYRAIIYDQRGTGQSSLSTVDSNTLTMDNMVEDIEALRIHLDIDEWVLLGHSFGGMLASYYATKHPDRIKGLILSSSGGIDLALRDHIDMSAHLTQLQLDSLRYYSRRIAEGDTSYATRLKRGQNLAPAYVFHDEHIPTIAERLTQGNMRINTLLWRDMERIGFDCEPGLEGFSKPVLIIQGTEDLLPTLIAEEMHAVFVKSELVLLKDCGHYGWLDRRDAYFKSVNSFINSL